MRLHVWIIPSEKTFSGSIRREPITVSREALIEVQIVLSRGESTEEIRDQIKTEEESLLVGGGKGNRQKKKTSIWSAAIMLQQSSSNRSSACFCL